MDIRFKINNLLSNYVNIKIIIILSLLIIPLSSYCSEKVITFDLEQYLIENILVKQYCRSKNDTFNRQEIIFKNNIMVINSIEGFSKYDYKPKENPFRRAEILFFGSLTFVAFGGWLFFSIFNTMIYDDSFGTIRNEQFLPLYLGSCIISFSVVISDLVITNRDKLKNIEIY